jgi:crossover junction endodeoxyribonuclease RuvC
MNANYCIAGVDPGSVSPGLAFRLAAEPQRISAEDLPTVAGQVDAAGFAARLEQMRPDVIVIEKVGSMPGQGVSSTFKFGVAFGLIQGVVAALKIETHFVAPAVWKKHFRIGADKEEARRVALQLWPDRSDLFGRKKDHNRAEAALIARYFSETGARQ